MRDIQNEYDERGIFIDKVGIRNLIIPMKVLAQDRLHAGSLESTVASLSLYVPLSKSFKGVNMSRFTEVVHRYLIDSEGEVSLSFLRHVASSLKSSMGADSAYVKARFPYFRVKGAPVSKKLGYMNYECTLEVKNVKGKEDCFVTVEVPYTSLCPCSKNISRSSAHNQRSTATVTVMMSDVNNLLYFEEVIDVVEDIASCELYSVLKRPDEKFVTERAYANPMFVEDMARDLHIQLTKWVRAKKIKGFVAVINHYESIHNHDAVAVIRGGAFVQ